MELFTKIYLEMNSAKMKAYSDFVKFCAVNQQDTTEDQAFLLYIAQLSNSALKPSSIETRVTHLLRMRYAARSNAMEVPSCMFAVGQIRLQAASGSRSHAADIKINVLEEFLTATESGKNSRRFPRTNRHSRTRRTASQERTDRNVKRHIFSRHQGCKK